MLRMNFQYDSFGGRANLQYVGLTINTHSLDIKKDYARSPNLSIGDTLNVDYTSTPGRHLIAKIFLYDKLYVLADS